MSPRPSDSLRSPSPAVPARVLAAIENASLPVLVYDLPAIRASIRRLTESFPRYFFPVKCNPHPEVLRAVMDSGAGFTARSLGEARLVLRLGADPRKVSFTGWGLGPTVMDWLTRARVSVILDSAKEVRTWLARRSGTPFGVRILAGAAPAYLNAGFTPSEVLPMLDAVRAAGGRLRTVQIHFPHETRTAEGLIRDWSFLPSLLTEAFGTRISALECINLGGGWPGSYGSGNAMDPAQVLACLRKDLLPALEKAGFSGRIAVEPGRFAAAPCGWWAAKVACVADGPVTLVTLETPPPIPSERMTFPVLLLRGSQGTLAPVGGESAACRLLGINPLPFSVIREGASMPAPRVGDVALLGQAGAYMERALNYATGGIRVTETAVEE